MKDQSRIPTNKVERATKFVATGVKIGGNYIKHYAKKAMNPDLSREELHRDNAADIYESLSELKGSALKVAQMMSMDKNLLPRAYSDKFQMSQYSAPPLSGPLVVKTFQEYFGKSPAELYDAFNLKASNAASIGQVHEATLKGKKLAVKIQYPGVANSISADLKMVKPVAVRLVGLNEADINRYMEEVESKLLEETDYELEVKRGTEISEACSQAIAGLVFPQYYPELSSKRIITMDWLDGMHLKEFLATNPTQEIRNRVGQTLWDFYEYQIHTLRQLHADPHPGNFLIRADGTVGVIDFGCVKEIPEWFYYKHFALLNPRNLVDKDKTLQLFYDLQFLYPNDEPREKALFFDIFVEMCNLLGKPFHTDTFDFADDDYFNSIYEYGENLSRMKEIKEQKVARGSKDALYINRTYFGLYSMLNELRANITTHSIFKTMTI